MRKNHKKVCRVLNYIGHLLILVCTVSGCISTSPFSSLVGISKRITSSPIELKICVITAVIKKCKPKIKKKKKKFLRL